MLNHVSSELIDTNTGLLRQTLTVLAQIDDVTFAVSPKGFEPHRVGGHLRHILEFYECFLDGLESASIDYDSRKRDELVERNRHAAATRICSIVSHLEDRLTTRTDEMVAVRMENADADIFLASSINRELQALSSHTIHHLALIAVTLRLHGFEPNADFGMSPSTLRYQAAKTVKET